jgi:hypothetical protein
MSEYKNDLSKAMAYNGMMPMGQQYADDMTRNDIYKAFTALMYGDSFDVKDPKTMQGLYAAKGYVDGMIDAFESMGYGEKGYGTKGKGMYSADTNSGKAHGGHCSTCTCKNHATIDDIIGEPRMRQPSRPGNRAKGN